MSPGRPQSLAPICAASMALFGPELGPNMNTGRSAFGRRYGQPSILAKWRVFISRSPRVEFENEHLPLEPLAARIRCPASRSRLIQPSIFTTPVMSNEVGSCTDRVLSHCSNRSNLPCSTNATGYDLYTVCEKR